MKKSRMFIVPAMAVVAIFAVACSGDDDPTATPVPPTATATTVVVEPTATTASSTPGTVAGDATRGATLFNSQGCAGCHSTGSNALVGPGLGGIKEKAAALGGDEYLVESIKDPSAVIVEGYTPIMQSFANLDDQAIADLVAYLNTLE